MSKFGRFEAKITVPTGGWSVSATNASGGPSTVTIPAGDYYPSDLLSTLQTQLNASRPSGWTVTKDFGESGTGKVTISCGGVATFSIVWTSTTLRDVLGFTVNIVGALTSTGSNAMKGVWLPDCPLSCEDDLTVGAYQSDARASISPSGAVYTVAGNSYRRLRGLQWSHVSKDRARSASSAPMPFEQFWFETQLGGHAAFAAGARLAFYTDAGANTLLGYYHQVGRTDTDMTQAVQGWTGRWGIELPDLIYQTSG